MQSTQIGGGQIGGGRIGGGGGGGRRRGIGFAIRIALLLLLVGGGLLWWLGRGGVSIEPGSTLVLELSGDYVEAPAPSLLSRALGAGDRPFAGLLSTLAKARRDPRLESVVLRVRGLGIGWGKAQELRDAVQQVRARGKRVVAVLELTTFDASRDYYVASAADRVVVAPGALSPVLGLAAEYLFLGGLWEKLGVEIESERIGRYKSAVESYTGREMSEAHREMADAILDSLHEQWIEGVAESRGLEAELVRRAVDSGPVLASELVGLGLVDGIAHVHELPELDGPVVKAETYAGVGAESVGFAPEARFALVYGSGPVVTGEGTRSPGGGRVFASDPVSEALVQAAEDPEIDAIILRIDSPGGSSLASELVWQAMQRARASGKPLIASLSDVAASGGYYAAVGADWIVADPGVLTGSIGVFVLRPVLGGLADKLGIEVESLTRGAQADFLLSMEPLSDSARKRLRSLVEETYDLFVERVAAGRPDLGPAQVDALGQGRVWTGSQAAERGLVDELGGLRTAVSAGRRLLDMDPEADVELVPYPAPRSLAEELAELLQGRLARPAPAWRALLPPALARLEPLVWDLPPRVPLAIPPFLIEFH